MIILSAPKIAIITCLILVSCSPEQSEYFSELREVKNPSITPSGQPYLQTDNNGVVYLSWIEQGIQHNDAFKFATFDNGVWSEAETILESDSFFVNWADVPSIFPVNNDTIAAHYLISSGEWVFAYDARVALSTDRGETWMGHLTPHRDGTKTEHGFASFFNHPVGGLGIAWLDGREAELKGAVSGQQGHTGNWKMQLRKTVFRDGEMGEERILDEMVCECCPTAAVETERSVIIAYRGRTENEIRDIYTVRYANGEWTSPSILHNDGWNIAGCPVNGPALSSLGGDDVVAAWYTAADNNPRVYTTFSVDGGITFSDPIRVDDGLPLGRVAVEMLDDGTALILWIELIDEAAELRVKRVSKDRNDYPSEKIATITDDRLSGFPRMARTGNSILFAWTDNFDNPHVRSAAGILR